MLFASLDFLLFLGPVLLGFWCARNRPMLRTCLLLGASYWFYMAGGRPPDGTLPTPWYFAGLLLASTVLDFVCALEIERSPVRRNLWLIISLVGNLGLLGYFKYTDFLLDASADLARALGLDIVVPHLDLLLPVGISFYTFQSLSYTIDVWRGRIEPERSFARFALFVVFFPQLVAGPIVRASEFLPQLRFRPRLAVRDLDTAVFRIVKGVAKKVILGDLIAASFTDPIFSNPDAYSSLENLLALYGFTLQIYADFSGYSDIAIGVAMLMGFTIPENFDRPYQARSVGEFWRRWHMTLSTWLRDYLFFPLGGSRGSETRTWFNLWLTMFLVGMWHMQPGMGWNFFVYGNLHALALLFNRWNRVRSRATSIARTVVPIAVSLGLGAAAWIFATVGLGLDDAPARVLAALAIGAGLFCAWLPESGRWVVPLHIVLTFHFTVLSRVFFRADGMEGARVMIDKLLGWDGAGVREGLFRFPPLAGVPAFGEYGLAVLLALGLLWHFTPRAWVDVWARDRFARLPAPVLALVVAVLGVVVMNVLEGPRANIYFAF